MREGYVSQLSSQIRSLESERDEKIVQSVLDSLVSTVANTEACV